MIVFIPFLLNGSQLSSFLLPKVTAGLVNLHGVIHFQSATLAIFSNNKYPRQISLFFFFLSIHNHW